MHAGRVGSMQGAAVALLRLPHLPLLLPSPAPPACPDCATCRAPYISLLLRNGLLMRDDQLRIGGGPGLTWR